MDLFQNACFKERSKIVVASNWVTMRNLKNSGFLTKAFFTGVEKISQKKDFYLKYHKVCVWLSDQLTKTRSSDWRCSIKKVLLKISQNSQEKTMSESLF